MQPGCVLLDVRMPGLSGPDLQARLAEIGNALPIVFLTGHADTPTTVRAIKAGAEDCVLKWKLARLGPAIQAALALRRPLGKLSPRQLEVLRLLAEGHATREIARRLTLSVKTVETHRAEIMRRLGIRDLAGLVRYALRVGLVPIDA